MSKEILKEIERIVVEGDIERAEEAAREALRAGLDPVQIIENGLNVGLKKVGEKFECGDYFLADLMAGAEASRLALEVLKPVLSKSEGRSRAAGRILLGTVEGDIHDIGKNIVSAMLTAAGFEVVDLGKDIPTGIFVEKVRELKPQVLGLSALMTTTRVRQKEILEALRQANCRDEVKVMVGGAAITPDWAKEIGADAYGRDGVDAVNKVKGLIASSTDPGRVE